MLLMEKIQDKSYAIQPAFGFSNVNAGLGVNNGLGANFQQILQELFTISADLHMPPLDLTPVLGLGAEVVTVGSLSFPTAPPPPSFQSSQNPLAPLPPPPNVSVSAVASATQTSQPSSSTTQSAPLALHAVLPPTPVILPNFNFVFNPATVSWEPAQN